MVILGDFPVELLASIFAHLSSDTRQLYRVSQVCRSWKEAAFGDSSLWLNITIRNTDVKHVDLVSAQLARAGQRLISMNLDLHPVVVDPQDLLAFATGLFKSNLYRCHTLKVTASSAVWRILLLSLENESFPNVGVVGITIMPPRAGLGFRGCIPLASVDGVGHLEMSGTSAIRWPFREVRCLRLTGQHAQLIDRDGHLNDWLTNGPQTLEFVDFVVPPMRLQLAQDSARISTIQELKFAALHPAKTDAGDESDCAPFFEALNTPALVTLELGVFHGRAFDDFLHAIHNSTWVPKCPNLRVMRFHKFECQDQVCDRISFLLRTLPHIENIEVTSHPTRTMQAILKVLGENSDICPMLSWVDVDGTRVNRDATEE